MKAETPDQPRILVVQTAFLGDVVLTTPLLAALRSRFPDCYLAFLGTPSGTELIRGLTGVDEFLVYDKRGGEGGLGGLRQKVRELKKYNFEIALSAHRSARTAALLALAGIPRRIGFATSALPWLYHQRAPRDPAQHEVLRNLALLDPLGGPGEGFKPRLRLPALPEVGRELLGEEQSGPRVGICPGSVWPTKRWRAEGFSRVAERLHEESGASIYLIGAREDQAAAEAVEHSMKCRALNLAGRTSLREWLALIAAMDLVITNDSSPTHLASALGVPVVAIFGPTTPAQGFAPWGNHHRIVETNGLGCRPCGEHGARRCPEGHMKCMNLIRPEAVLSAAVGLLRENS